MQALVKKYAREGLWLEEQPKPEYGINDVLIKVLETSICGTDVHIYNWDEWARKTIPVPMIIGHEFVGRVEAVGGNVHDCSIGDVVSAEGHVVCGRCRNCLAGARYVVITDVNDYRLELARKMGVTSLPLSRTSFTSLNSRRASMPCEAGTAGK